LMSSSTVLATSRSGSPRKRADSQVALSVL